MENKKIILGITGELASGKGIVSEYLIKKHKASYFKLSNSLRDILKIINQDITRKNMNSMSTALRKIFGEDFLAKALLQKIEKEKNKIIIVDGVRKPAEIKFFKKTKNFKLIYVTAKREIRYKRIIKRLENNDEKEKTSKQFKKDNKLEAELDIATIGKKANYTITNENDLKNLYEQINNIIIKIKK